MKSARVPGGDHLLQISLVAADADSIGVDLDAIDDAAQPSLAEWDRAFGDVSPHQHPELGDEFGSDNGRRALRRVDSIERRLCAISIGFEAGEALGRKVTANMSLTLDGRYSGPGGPGDMGAILPYAVTEVARNHLCRIWETVTTVVLGRVNAEGFLGYWPSVAKDENADLRDRGYAKWLTEAEKVVFSTTLNEPPWARSRIVNAPAAAIIGELKARGEGDILVNSSASVIKPLLAADVLDRLYLMICPEIAGGGQRLFDDGLHSSKWRLSHQEVGQLGGIALVYARLRNSIAVAP